jgi:D-3-phosphoglycerate dehydrogenase
MIKVTAESFLKNAELCAELKSLFPDAVLWEKRETLAEFCADAEALIVGREKISDGFLAGCPNLKLIAKYGVGLDNIDIPACERRGIKIGWTGGVNKTSVAELTLAFMLGAAHNIFFTGTELKKGNWFKNGGHLLSGRTVGIIGVGFVGKEIVRMLKPFGCEILVNDIVNQAEFYESNNLSECLKSEIYARADIISLNVPLTHETHVMMGKAEFDLLKPEAILVNTSRGEILDEEALKNWLNENPRATVCVDVFHGEPTPDRELLEHPRVFGTPHIGGNAYEAVLAMGRSALYHVKHYYDQKKP